MLSLMKKTGLVIVTITLCLLSACNAESTGGKGEDKGNTVNIGYTGPLSGPAAVFGERALSGLEMAADEINDEGGFEVDGKKYTIKIQALDDKYMPNEAGSNAKRLVQEHKTPIIFAPHSGGISAMQVFNERDKFLIGAYTSEPAVTEGGNKLTVRVAPGFDGYVGPFSEYPMERFGEKIALLPPSTEYGKEWTKELKGHLKESGGEVVYETSIDFSKETDFFTIITNALKNDPDVMLIGGSSEATAKVVKQARELGFKGGFVVMEQAKFDEMKAITGTYEILEGAAGIKSLVEYETEEAKTFMKNYRDSFKMEPGSEAGLNYLSLYVFVEAMKTAGSVDDAEAIRKAIAEGIKNVPAEKQVYVINGIREDGSFELALNMSYIEDGKVISVDID